MIRDAYTMNGLTSEAQLEDLVWPVIAKTTSVELRHGRRTAEAYINDNRWIADCPEDDCAGAMHASPALDRGCCFSCGVISKVRIPDEWKEAVKVLEARPEGNRYWRPAEETVKDLKVENVLRGHKPKAD